LWTCIDGFEDLDVWIHVETEFDVEMWFIYYIVVNICDEIWVLWYICDKLWFKCKKTEKRKQKNAAQLYRQKLDKFFSRAQLCRQANFADINGPSLCRQPAT
jgi:hypothetical protein